ncbi:(Na+)-NQR maturation NqrM [Microbulbifer agarilyticus]|uniref:(Na+)-NQR maturation NqrM n=1 Tax=Microbulbifer agarilyticus TaxID=260552 RepID=UPI001CD5BBEE|nr:(Na+)-NQR maturation NqrM [Microbulbifer agarilyticus]MCA0901451.1 (Na+)-NQR maturation NqrM [Microbulbifer agarilyticus]
MTIYILAFVVVALVITGMALGAIVQNKPLKGSCGGLNNIGMKENCDICGGDDDECEKEQERQRQAALNKTAAADFAYDATSKSDQK